MSTTQESLQRTKPTGLLEINGELVVWTGERLDFDALQERMVSTAATVRRRLVPAKPASFVAFDVLAVGSVDVRPMRWTARRQRLESLAERWYTTGAPRVGTGCSIRCCT